jgi:hypothetical protein
VPPRPPVPAGLNSIPAGLKSIARDPRHTAAAGIGAALAVLSGLTDLIAIAPGDRFSDDLLGISPEAGPDAAVKRLTALWTELDRAAQDYERSYGEIPPGDGRR